MKNIILTGDRPTGRLHLGHYVGSLKERVRIQNEEEYEHLLVMIADTQALTDNYGNPTKVRDNVIEVLLDYLSVGLDPAKTTFFIQSQVKALAELTVYYMNLVTLPRVLRNPTVKNEIKERGFDSEKEGIPVGFATYPISQASDITAFKANIVPVGDDQLPMIEQAREIVKTFNNTYEEVLVMPNAVIPQNEKSRRLPGIDGNAKMSKSLGNCIYLTDDSKTLKEKINKMYTDPLHINISDPGHIEGNIVFTYLDVFATAEHFKKYLPEYHNLEELKLHYQKGGLGDAKIKKFLYDILEEILTPIRLKRQKYAENIAELLNILKDGCAKANQLADETLSEVKKAMGISYFTDETFLEEQKIKYPKKEN